MTESQTCECPEPIYLPGEDRPQRVVSTSCPIHGWPGERLMRYAEAIHGARYVVADVATPFTWVPEARAVIAVADAERSEKCCEAEATSLKAKVSYWRSMYDDAEAEAQRQYHEAQVAEAALARVEALAQRLEAEGINCECGHDVGGDHNGLGCYHRDYSLFPEIQKCPCTKTDDQDEADIVVGLLKEALRRKGLTDL